MQMSETAMRALIAAHFPVSEVENGLRISWRESNWDPLQHNDNYLRGGGDNSYGLFQINMIGSLGETRRRDYNILINELLYDPNMNAAIARRIWDDNGGSWTGSDAWGSIPATVNYPSGGNGNVPGQWSASDQAAWDALPQDVRDFYNGLPAAVVIVPRIDGLTDAQWDAVQRWWEHTRLGDTDVLTSNPGLGILDWTKALGKFFSVLVNPEFWKRVGLGVLAAVIILLAFVVFNKETIQEMK